MSMGLSYCRSLSLKDPKERHNAYLTIGRHGIRIPSLAAASMLLPAAVSNVKKGHQVNQLSFSITYCSASFT